MKRFLLVGLLILTLLACGSPAILSPTPTPVKTDASIPAARQVNDGVTGICKARFFSPF